MEESANYPPCKECLDNGVNPAPPAEADHIKQHLSERDDQIISLEADFLKYNIKIRSLEEQSATWREKYERLYDSHKRVQKLNQNLESKLLQMVDKMKDEKSQLTKDIATLSIRLAESKHCYSVLQKENERYKNDMNLAIQLLQCNPDNFVSHRLDSLSTDTQNRVSQYIMSKTKSSGPSNTKPNDNDNTEASEYEFNISASLMAKILAGSFQDTVTKHCDSCACSSKSQSKPFAYNESHYSVATQTILSGEMKNSYCLNCNEEIKNTMNSENAAGTDFKIVKERYGFGAPRPMYIIPQPSTPDKIIPRPEPEKVFRPSDIIYNMTNAEKRKSDLEMTVQNKILNKIGEDLAHMRSNSGMETEPAEHHMLCERIKTAASSKKTSDVSIAKPELYVKDLPLATNKQKKESLDNASIRKSSQGSMGCPSRTSSLAQSTSSANKSNTQVGPGPRFCSLRMQAGSKNILLDNAQPDVPPVLYKRQPKYSDDLLPKDANEGLENFVENDQLITESEKIVGNTYEFAKNNNNVVETTLIDVHVENHNKDYGAIPKNNTFNPVLLNVSSSPLQPLKSHSFTSNSDQNDKLCPTKRNNNIANVDKLLTKSHSDIVLPEEKPTEKTVNTTNESQPLKIFNFDSYEQKDKMPLQGAGAFDKEDINIQNTKISKDLELKDEIPIIAHKSEVGAKTPLPSVVNVYPNLTQSHLKVNEIKRAYTNEQSSSSLSSNDSAVILQKQQLRRVAEWVEQNLEQQNTTQSIHDESSVEEDVHIAPEPSKLELMELEQTLHKSSLNMPHPVSKYSRMHKEHRRSLESSINASHRHKPSAVINNIVKETIFPVESEKEESASAPLHVETMTAGDVVVRSIEVERISREELARMEYNVKTFLLNGPYWVRPAEPEVPTYAAAPAPAPAPADRSRRTSSKTETDV